MKQTLPLLLMLIREQPVVKEKMIQLDWQTQVAGRMKEILGYRVFRSRHRNGYKAVWISSTLFPRYTDYEPMEGPNYYSIVPVTRTENLASIDIEHNACHCEQPVPIHRESAGLSAA